MWHDELALARNVEDRGLAGLVTRPLDHLQVAPVGALAVLDVTSTLAGVSDAGLRLGPWILSIAALLLFWRASVCTPAGPCLSSRPSRSPAWLRCCQGDGGSPHTPCPRSWPYRW
jgi:hypothetical protein